VIPDTDVDALSYAQREAESPEAGEFVGGDGTLTFLVLVVVVFVLVFLFLDREGKI
jgi:hypothetical protein